MEKNPLLSVIIPAYNSGNYIIETLESIICQSFTDYEIIIVDDGSTDDTSLKCNEFIAEHGNKRIYYYYQDNKGVSAARNYGLNFAQGKYIHFMDSDDLIVNEMYSVFAKLVDNYNPDIIIGGVQVQRTSSSELLHVPKDIYYKDTTSVSSFLEKLTVDNKDWMLNVLWNKWFRADIIRANCIEFKNICPGEDYEFVAHYLCLTNSIYVSKDIVYKYIVKTSGSLISNRYNYKSQIQRRSTCWDQTKNLMQKYGFSNSAFDIAEGYSLYSALYSYLIYDKDKSFTYKLKIVQSFIDGTYFSSILLYFNNTGGFLKRLEKIIFTTRNGIAILIYILMKQRVQKHLNI